MTFSMATVNSVDTFRLPSGNGHACEAGFASKCTSIVRLGAAFHNGCEVLCSGNATALRKKGRGIATETPSARGGRHRYLRHELWWTKSYSTSLSIKMWIRSLFL